VIGHAEEDEQNAMSAADKRDADQSASARALESHRRRKCLLIAVAVSVSLGVLGTRHARQSARQAQCRNNLWQIGLALSSWHSRKSAFPCAVNYSDAGVPMHSWRTRLLEDLSRDSFLDTYDFEEPWNGPRNRLLSDDIPDTFYGEHMTRFECVYFPEGYRCPNAPWTQSRLCTNYVMLIDDRPGKPNGPPHLPGSVSPSSVMVLEIADSDILWMEPRDVLLSELSLKINDRSKCSLSSYHGGACVVQADGTVKILDEATTEERVRELLTQ
jgi:hypothetical protein